MKKNICLLLFIFSIKGLAAGGSSGIGPAGDQIDLLIQGTNIQAVFLDDSQYIEMLSKVGSDVPVRGVGDIIFDSYVWPEELTINRNIPLIKFYDDSGAERYFVGRSTIEKHFENVDTSEKLKFKHIRGADTTNRLQFGWEEILLNSGGGGATGTTGN